ncbi:hypothetical protein [Amycolatopsis jejuensis]|uniref:hypothetical protein n=1 Tax=Amycolatopsis jejuensis TaxID=330084 RepID=UPI0005242C53|nr:hypothetical protein [Amycolatopsis jejuensis]
MPGLPLAGFAAAPPASALWEVGVSLVVAGVGLEVFIRVNNSGAIPARTSATGGGLVNMARGLGTALVTWCLRPGEETAAPAGVAR